MNKYYNIHNLILVEIDFGIKKWVQEQIDFQIESFKSDEGVDLKYQITIEPYNNFKNTQEGSLSNFHYSRFISAKFLNEKQKNLAVSRTSNGYKIYTDTPVLINLFIQALLINEGMTFVHAAAIKKPAGGIILLPGAGGVGKTAIMGSMVKERGYKLLGDDLIFLDENGKCLSFPRPFILKEYHRDVYPELFKELGLGKKNKNIVRESIKFLIKNAPFLDVTQKTLKKLKLYDKAVYHAPLPTDYLAAVSVERVLGDNCVASSGDIEEIIFLERYQGDDFVMEKINEPSLSNRMFSIIHHEWADYIRQLFVLGSTELIDLDAYFEKVPNIIRSGIKEKDSRKLLIPQDSSPKELYEFILEAIK